MQNWRFGSSKGYSKTLVKAKSQTKTSRVKPYTGQCCGKTQKSANEKLVQDLAIVDSIKIKGKLSFPFLYKLFLFDLVIYVLLQL